MQLGANRNNGEERLLEQLHETYRGPLMSFFLRRVRNHADAEDLTQEVFARLAKRDNNEVIERADHFIFRVATNLLRDRARMDITRSQRTHFSIADVKTSEPPAVLVEENSADRVLMVKQSLSQVLQWLDELGERTRQIFILHRLEQMSHRDIARMLGISSSNVEKHVIRATAHIVRKSGRP